MFLGTPYRGSEVVPWAMLFSTIVNLATLGYGVRKNLLRQLDQKSKTLTDISQQFVHRTPSLKIMSFIEQQAERPLSTLVGCCSRSEFPGVCLLIAIRLFPNTLLHWVSPMKWLFPSMPIIVACAGIKQRLKITSWWKPLSKSWLKSKNLTQDVRSLPKLPFIGFANCFKRPKCLKRPQERLARSLLLRPQYQYRPRQSSDLEDW